MDGPLAKSKRAGAICYLDEIVEARRDGIHSYCVTIDKKTVITCHICMCTAVYTAINEVQQLPLKISDIYRRLTT